MSTDEEYDADDCGYGFHIFPGGIVKEKVLAKTSGKENSKKHLFQETNISLWNPGEVITAILPKRIKASSSLKREDYYSASQRHGGIDLDATNLSLDVRPVNPAIAGHGVNGQASSAISPNVHLRGGQGGRFDIENFQGFTFQIIRFNRNQSPESVFYPSQDKESSNLP